MFWFISIAIAILSALLIAFYLERRQNKDFQWNFFNTIKKQKKVFIVSLILFIIAALFMTYIFRDSSLDKSLLYRWMILMYGIFLIALIDAKERLIPNEILLSLLVIRLGFMVYESIAGNAILRYELLSPIIGMLIGGGIIFLAMLISRKGIGMGDIKLFGLMGLYTGSQDIVTTMFCTFIFSAIAGVFLLITKRAKLKDTIPLAPFAAAGVWVNFFLVFAGTK